MNLLSKLQDELSRWKRAHAGMVAFALKDREAYGRDRLALRHSELVRADLEKERDRYETRALRAEEAVWALLTPDQLRAGGFNDVAEAVEKARRG